MTIRSGTALVLTALVGCQPSATRDPAAAFEAQADLATDTAQARLWRDAAQADPEVDLEQLTVPEGAVRTPDRTRVSETAPQERPQQAFPQAVTDAVVVHSVPEQVGAAFVGRATIVEVAGDYVSLDIGGETPLRLQVRAGGQSLQMSPGEAASFSFSQGTPTARNDVIALRTENEDFVYALVGAVEPVRLTVPTFELTAAQVGGTDGNTMAVDVSFGGEVRRLQVGEEASFRAGLTVKALASIAVQGQGANALPGRPYRIELMGWRSR